MTALYPLRFETIYQYRIWGGQRLRQLVNAPLPDGQPIGEAWLLSDRDDHPSVVAEGPLTGQSLRHVLEEDFHTTSAHRDHTDSLCSEFSAAVSLRIII